MKKAPTPEAVAAEMSRVVRVANEIADMAQSIVDEYAELNDGAYRKFDTSGQLNPIGSGKLSGVDPTGATAVSGQHERMRYQMRRTAYHFRKIRPHLERAQDQMVEAWAEQDPEAAEKLRRLRQLEKEIAAEEA